MSKTFVVFASMLGCLLAASTALAADSPKITLKTFAEPADKAEALKIFGAASDFSETTLAADVPEGGVTSPIDLPKSAAEASVFVVWSDGRRTEFPIVLASAFADQTVDIYLWDRPVGARPSPSVVRQACDQSAMSGISGPFDTLFTCKSYALALENAGDQWEPDYRRALSGWMRANYALATLARPVSPYGVDPDLVSRLEQALAKEEDEHWGDRRWAPLRLVDARELVDLSSTTVVRLVGFVPDLVRQGDYAAAKAINDDALAFWSAAHDSLTVHGVSTRLLEDNQAYLDNLISADW